MLPTPDAVTAATPMTAIQDAADPHVTPLAELVLGTTNGSLGETSAIACLIGGLYLLIRRTAAWQIPAGMLAAAAVCGVLTNNQPQPGWTILHQLSGGALLFGAFFIATDPVSSPLTPKGRWIYGIGAGLLVVLMRYLSAYPEGVMFSVLLMNSLVPLINRWTIPRPWGGRVGEAARG
jgi:electron transport complex protein RnfD